MRSPATYPDILIIAPAADKLVVAAYWVGLREATPLWQEVLPFAEWDELPQRLTSVLTRRATRSKTPVALVAPAGVGGFILYPRAEGELCDGPWVSRQIELTLPYPAEEIVYRVRCNEALAEMYWVPNDWVKAQQLALEKLGLVLEEVLPRASLFAVNEQSDATRVLIEGQPTQASLYQYERGAVSQAIQLPSATNEAELTAMLPSILAVQSPDAALRFVVLDDAQAADRMLALWQDESVALRVAGSRWQLWQPAMALALVVVMIVMMAPAYLYWAGSSMQEQLVLVQKEQRSLAKKVVQFQDDQQTVSRESGFVQAVKEIDAAPLPLETLAKVVESLPDNAWMQSLTYTGKTLVIAGKGISDGELAKRLEQDGLVVSQMRSEPVQETNDFRLRVQRAPESSDKQEVK